MAWMFIYGLLVIALGVCAWRSTWMLIGFRKIKRTDKNADTRIAAGTLGMAIGVGIMTVIIAFSSVRIDSTVIEQVFIGLTLMTMAMTVYLHRHYVDSMRLYARRYQGRPW